MSTRPQVRIDPNLPEAPLPHKRSLFLFPGYDTVPDYRTAVAALRRRQKFELAYKTTFDSSLLIRAAFTTGFDEAAALGPRYGDGASGAAKLYAYNATNLASMIFFTDGLLPVVFHQDPRYFRKGFGSVKSRIGWALRGEIVAFNDRGIPVPNYSEMLGFGMSAALSDAYLPPQNVSPGKTIESIGIKEGVQFGFNLAHEFHAVKLVEQKLAGQ
jgi:hypothetical protein